MSETKNTAFSLPNDSVVHLESEVYAGEVCDTNVYFATADEPSFVISGSRIEEFKKAMLDLYEEFAI